MGYKISFCTVCMNRLHHLRKTLPKNIEDNQESEVEFVVLDYNSSDGLSDWIKENMSLYIDKGLLIYYQYDKAKYFDRSHSRNMIFKLASGDVICNVDADNYLGRNFGTYVDSVFTGNDNAFLIPDTKRRFYYIRDALGRFCIKKKDFLAARGYDEKMNGYGFEDDDLYDRLSYNGKNEMIIRDLKFLQTIQHTDEARVENEFFANFIDDIFIHYESPKRSHVILLYKDKSFDKGAIIPNEAANPSPAVIENLEWMKGTWRRKKGIVILDFMHADTMHLNEHQNILMNDTQTFYKINHAAFLRRLPYDLSLITNYSRHLFNKENRSLINKQGFGKGSVYKNFSLLTTEVITTEFNQPYEAQNQK